MMPVPRVADLTKSDAAQVKEEVIRLLSDNGRRQLRGYKVSLSRTWGALFDGDVLSSPARIERSSLFEPLIETEAVMWLDAEISSNMTITDVMARTHVSAGIEVADSRFENWLPADPARLIMPRPADTEADNAFASCVVIDSVRVAAHTLPLPKMTVAAYRDGVRRAQGLLENAMGHPANAVLWLARELESAGRALLPGQFVFTGNPYPEFITLDRGQRATFQAVIDGVGTSTANFV